MVWSSMFRSITRQALPLRALVHEPSFVAASATGVRHMNAQRWQRFAQYRSENIPSVEEAFAARRW